MINPDAETHGDSFYSSSPSRISAGNTVFKGTLAVIYVGYNTKISYIRHICLIVGACVMVGCDNSNGYMSIVWDDCSKNEEKNQDKKINTIMCFCCLYKYVDLYGSGCYPGPVRRSRATRIRRESVQPS
jgi:hypothetical protein